MSLELYITTLVNYILHLFYAIFYQAQFKAQVGLDIADLSI